MSRKRNVKLEFWVSPDEKEQIEQKMAELGTENLSAYLRKMAIDGRILKLDLPELRELLSLMRRYSGNLNQIAKRINSTHRIYDADLEDIQTSQAKLWRTVRDMVSTAPLWSTVMPAACFLPGSRLNWTSTTFVS